MSTRYYNTLEIIGSDDQVKEVLDFCKSEPDADGICQLIDFNKILPLPEEFRMPGSATKKNSDNLYIDRELAILGDVEIYNIITLDVDGFNQFPVPYLQFAGSRDLRYP